MDSSNPWLLVLLSSTLPMKKHNIKISSIEKVTHDVLRIVTNKPEGFMFIPGQAVGLSIDKPKWNEEKRPFTFTSIPSDDYLEFTIKTYPEHNGQTNEMLQLKEEDTLIMSEVFGNIKYREEGVFIAGGAGITPFISIIRELHHSDAIGDNKLIFANKTHNDIIYEKEFYKYLGDNFISILSDEDYKHYDYGMITAEYLMDHCDIKNKIIYLCGPPTMMESIEMELYNMNINPHQIVKESF